MINKLLTKKLLLQINFDVRNVLTKLPKNKRNNHFSRQKLLQNWTFKLLQIAQKSYQKNFLMITCLRESKEDRLRSAGGPAVVWTSGGSGAASLLAMKAVVTVRSAGPCCHFCRRRSGAASAAALMSSSSSSSSSLAANKIESEKKAKYLNIQYPKNIQYLKNIQDRRGFLKF